MLRNPFAILLGRNKLFRQRRREDKRRKTIEQWLKREQRDAAS